MTTELHICHNRKPRSLQSTAKTDLSISSDLQELLQKDTGPTDRTQFVTDHFHNFGPEVYISVLPKSNICQPPCNDRPLTKFFLTGLQKNRFIANMNAIKKHMAH